MKKHSATGLKEKKCIKNCMHVAFIRVCDFHASSRESVPLKQVLEITVWLCSRKQILTVYTPRGKIDVEWMETDACVIQKKGGKKKSPVTETLVSR